MVPRYDTLIQWWGPMITERYFQQSQIVLNNKDTQLKWTAKISASNKPRLNTGSSLKLAL